MRRNRTRWLLPAALAVMACCAAGTHGLAQDPIDFNQQVRPIFVRHCLACHGGVKQAGGLSFVTRELAMAEADSGAPVIEPGDHEASYLYERVVDPDDDTRMPPPEHGRRLDKAELATLRRWIDEGAGWDKPWAFRPPEPTAVPEVAQSDWPRQQLDAFVLARLESEGRAPAAEADRAQWLRRASFDLIGLPPTGQELTAFKNDTEIGAHERAVDRLLASPHFGERWAAVWLDLARYADTMGFEKDPERTIWPWRDWVVKALNKNTPYDEFLLKQTAGDLEPGATLEDRLATAFHRNTQTNTEGGTDDEEYRWAAVIDRVDSTWSGLLGLSMGCARCHDHPYDPLTQSDYYRFAALLNTTQDADLHEDLPRLAVPKDPERFAEADRIDTELREVREEIYRRGLALAESREPWETLPIDHAESSGQTRLVLRTGDRGVEVLAEGTITDRSSYTLSAPAPASLSDGRRVTALRIDASPKDPTAALALPEMGFVLSNLRAFVEHAGGEEEEVFLAEVLADEADGFFRPIDSIRDNNAGWGPYTRMRRPRWAAFVFAEPLELAEGERLRLEIKHGKATDGQGPLVMQRFRVATTDDPALAALNEDSAFLELREREETLLAQRKKIASVLAPVLREQPPAFRRQTCRLERGAFLAPQETVEPATPRALPGRSGDRLAMARWLGSDENPLTSRVMVNRVWAELFGRGLVETLDDFGSTGASPTHPALLDHLAIRFREDLGWSLKGLLREIVLSSTYRQDARATEQQIAADRSNRLLGRGPRGRLSAEMVRDQALVVSGQFNPRVGGPPVMPYQPAGVWRSVYNNRRWETAAGDERFRRALYTYWKRTAAYPSLMAFDAPSREQCTVRRPSTNTPLQALVTLNDPAFVELAGGLADRMLARDADTPRQRIAWAAEEVTSRPLSAASLDELVKLYEETLSEDSIDERFAMTVVANVLLNLDAALTK
ncbi:Planctomycete cytochrome C [Planctomycetes bacterium MalM25]|nr:Planctomycete cytochrome C [Planctomycetes bacterium MalM25]